MNPNEASADAISKATDAAEAIERARTAQAEAAQQKSTDSIVEALREVFGENVEAKRFIDVSKIPLICQSIVNIHGDIRAIKDMMKEKSDDHEIRIRAMERNQWKWIGVMMIIPPLVTIAIAYVIGIISK